MQKILLIVFLFINSLVYSQSGWVAQTIGNKNYVDLNFINSTTGFIIRKDSVILKTINSGNNWITINTGISSQSSSIGSGFFTSENLAALGALDVVYRTTNGGQSWNFGSTPGLGLRGISMSIFINQMAGYSCGSDFYPFPTPCCNDGVLWKTTNGGTNYFEVLRVGASDFTELKYISEDSISVLGNTSIYYTYNGGANWIEKSFFMNPFINGGSFTNPFKDTIFIAGDLGGVLRSTNKGSNWSMLLSRIETGNLNKISFINSRTGFAIGDNGKILYTSNAGINWLTQNSQTTQNLNSIWFINKDTGFVVGDSGTVLKTITAGLTNINPVSNVIPNEFNLYQNYPNPFNPLTNIRFKIAKAGFTTLKIYEISGKEVELLVNENLGKGEYEVSWNAEKYTSGIYFYALQNRSLKHTKKMILVK